MTNQAPFASGMEGGTQLTILARNFIPLGVQLCSWVQFDCHPEQAFFAQPRIGASRAMRLLDAIVARPDRFLIKLHHHPVIPNS
jgi:hypothetical protein